MNILFFSRLNVAKNLKILEIGCGTGYFCNYLIKKGYKQISGCDVAESAIRFAKRNFSSIEFSMIKGDILPYKDNEFDVVLSFDVIEHIPNVEKHFSEVQRVLNGSGKYFFGTPHKYWDLLLLSELSILAVIKLPLSIISSIQVKSRPDLITSLLI